MGFKVTSCQSWSSQEKVCHFSHSSRSVCKRIRPGFENAGGPVILKHFSGKGEAALLCRKTLSLKVNMFPLLEVCMSNIFKAAPLLQLIVIHSSQVKLKSRQVALSRVESSQVKFNPIKFESNLVKSCPSVQYCLALAASSRQFLLSCFFWVFL